MAILLPNYALDSLDPTVITQTSKSQARSLKVEASSFPLLYKLVVAIHTREYSASIFLLLQQAAFQLDKEDCDGNVHETLFIIFVYS